jgi:hypothetical protein
VAGGRAQGRVAKIAGLRKMTPNARDPNQLAKSIIDIVTGQKQDRDPVPEEQGISGRRRA